MAGPYRRAKAQIAGYRRSMQISSYLNGDFAEDTGQASGRWGVEAIVDSVVESFRRQPSREGSKPSISSVKRESRNHTSYWIS